MPSRCALRGPHRALPAACCREGRASARRYDGLRLGNEARDEGVDVLSKPNCRARAERKGLRGLAGFNPGPPCSRTDRYGSGDASPAIAQYLRSPHESRLGEGVNLRYLDLRTATPCRDLCARATGNRNGDSPVLSLAFLGAGCNRGVLRAAGNCLSRSGLSRGYNNEIAGHEQIPSFTMPIAYMPDTTVFNHVLRDSVDVHTLREDRALFVTHVQLRELQGRHRGPGSPPAG
jgi:hypothetical protein